MAGEFTGYNGCVLYAEISLTVSRGAIAPLYEGLVRGKKITHTLVNDIILCA